MGGKQQEIKYLRESKNREVIKKDKKRDWERISFSRIDYYTNMHLTRGSIENQAGNQNKTDKKLAC